MNYFQPLGPSDAKEKSVRVCVFDDDVVYDVDVVNVDDVDSDDVQKCEKEEPLFGCQIDCDVTNTSP
eukprot:gene11923-20220_t